MDKSTRMSKVKSRLQAAEGVLKKCEEKLEQVEKVKTDKFSDDEMAASAKVAAEGLDLNLVADELRSMKLAPPPVVELVARCVCTLASGDDMGDLDVRAAEVARDNARKKKNVTLVAKGQAPPKPTVPLQEKKKLLTWEDSQKVLARANFKERIANYDGRMLLDNEDIVSEVKARVDLSSIDPTKPMSELLAPPKKSKKERNDEAIAAVRRREAHNEGVAEGGAGALLTLDDARYVSKIAPPLLVWIARVIAQHTVNDPMWKRTSAACFEAIKKRDEAKEAVLQLRKKVDEIAVMLREEKAKAKLEKEKADDNELLKELQEEEKKDKDADKPKELTTPSQVVLSGPTPNIFFQNGRISGIAPRPVQLSPRLQLPTTIYFFIRVKHCRVSYPFPPSLPVEQYLHRAQVIPGHEEAGPVAHVPFDGAHVIGLYEHEHLSFMQLVLEVPSTDKINPMIHPTRLSFHPRHGAQLHCGSGGAGTIEMPRIIVTTYPHLVSRHEARLRAASAPPARIEDGASAADDAASIASGSIAASRHSGTSSKPPPSVNSSSMSFSQQSKSMLAANSPGPTGAGGFIPPSMGLVPPLSMPDVVRSIGSAYRAVGRSASAASRASGSPAKVRVRASKNQEQDWSRVAIALSARAHKGRYALSRPGQQRPIPDILLEDRVVSLVSAKRLTRSTAKVGLSYIKEMAKLVAKVTEGYVLSSDERRRLKEAADMEAEVEKLDKQAEAVAVAEREAAKAEALKLAAARAAASNAAAAAEQQTSSSHNSVVDNADGDEFDAQSVNCAPPPSDAGSVASKVAAERATAESAAAAERQRVAAEKAAAEKAAAEKAAAEMAAAEMAAAEKAAAEKAAAEAKAQEAEALEAKAREAVPSGDVPDAAAFGELFDPSLAATAALVVGAAASPAAADLAQDAFAAAVEASSAKKAAAAPKSPAVKPPKLTTPSTPSGSGQKSARSSKPSSPSSKGNKSARGDGSTSARGRPASPRGSGKASPGKAKKSVPALPLATGEAG